MKLTGPQLIARMALLNPRRIELETTDGKLFIGWEIEPDEHMASNEGLEMIRAVERHASLNFAMMRASMMRSMSGLLWGRKL